MKILVAGDFQYDWYQPAIASALERLGLQVVRFAWSEFFNYLSLKDRIQIRMMRGPAFIKLNRSFERKVRDEHPDVVFVWLGWPLWPEVIGRLRQTNSATWISYTNDDPFSPIASKTWWRFFRASIPFFDIHLTFRHINISEFYRAGAKKAALWRAYYIPSVHHPYQLDCQDQKRFSSDVTFIGHYEDDGRVEYLKALFDAGLRVKLFGAGWTDKALRNLPLRADEVSPLFGEKYAKAIIGARAALCFLSRLNRDTYTRRCFEIPACGGLLLSEYTDDLATLYEPNKEALYFSSVSELVEKALWVMNHRGCANDIRAAGHARCLRDGHDVDSRAREMLELAVKLRSRH
jgi:spore maturation protein CgeB